MSLTDTHAHLTFDPLRNHLDDVLTRARHAGVHRVLVPSYDVASWDQVRTLMSLVGVYGAFGIHPWKADEKLDPETLQQMASLPKAVAIGEIGLDFKVNGFNRDDQILLFERQLEVAVALDRPVMLHCRGAFMEMMDILKTFGGRVRGVVHAFSRGPDLAEAFVRLGLHIAFGGAITRTNARNARAAAMKISLDRIVLETDCPSIGLAGVDAEHVEPRHVADVAAELALLRQVPMAEVAQATTRNAISLFGLGSDIDGF